MKFGQSSLAETELLPAVETQFLFPGHSMPSKLVVAVDVDEVLGSFLSALNKFIADRYCAIHSVSEYYVYEFFKIWNCSRAEGSPLCKPFCFRWSVTAKIRDMQIFMSPCSDRRQPKIRPRMCRSRYPVCCYLTTTTNTRGLRLVQPHRIHWLPRFTTGKK